MYTIRTLNNISQTGLGKLPPAEFTIDPDAANPDGIIMRSFDMHQMELPENLLGVARARAGTNNIAIDKCSERGIPTFNTPVAITNTRGKGAVLVGEDEWAAIEETLYLMGVPGMAESLIEGRDTPAEDCVDESELEW